MKTKVCPSLLLEGFDTYSPLAISKMFDRKKISHLLPYNLESRKILFENNRRFISISGFQDKYSMVLEDKTLRPTKEGEQGQYILKPISDLPKNKEYAPANEHLTMQIAKQVFGIETAENALIFFNDESPAYLTKRFDVKTDGTKLAVEDFSSLLEKTPQTDGEQYKYTGSYLDLFMIMKEHIPAWKIEQIKLFQLILFNYLFSNGDAHLKNFSIIETEQGDFKLSLSYDLMNTQLHIDDSDFALSDGLYPKAQGGILHQFKTLANQVEISEKIVEKTIKHLTSHSDKVINLVQLSFLNERLKRNYIQSYQRRLKKLNK